MESDGVAVVDVIRLGHCREKITVRFVAEQVDMFAAASSGDFSPVAGTLELGPSQFLGQIHVPLSNDANWELMENFRVRLIECCEPQHAQLGSLRSTTCYIVDDDVFPENFLKPPGPWRLLLGFIRSRWKKHWRTLLVGTVCITYESVHFTLRTLIPFILIDHVLVDIGTLPHGAFPHPEIVLPMCAAYLASALICWLCEHHFFDFGMLSTTLKDLRVWLVCKFGTRSEGHQSGPSPRASRLLLLCVSSMPFSPCGVCSRRLLSDLAGLLIYSTAPSLVFRGNS